MRRRRHEEGFTTAEGIGWGAGIAAVTAAVLALAPSIADPVLSAARGALAAVTPGDDGAVTATATGTAADLEGTVARSIADGLPVSGGTPLPLEGTATTSGSSGLSLQIEPGDPLSVDGITSFDPGGGQDPIQIFPDPTGQLSVPLGDAGVFGLGIGQTDVPYFGGSAYGIVTTPAGPRIVQLAPDGEVRNGVTLSPSLVVGGTDVTGGAGFTFNTETGQITDVNGELRLGPLTVGQTFGRPGAVPVPTLTTADILDGIATGTLTADQVLGATYGTERGPIRPGATTFTLDAFGVPISAGFQTDPFSLARIGIGDPDNPASASGGLTFDPATGQLSQVNGRVPFFFGDGNSGAISAGYNPVTGDYQIEGQIQIGELPSPAEQAAAEQQFAANVGNQVTQAVNDYVYGPLGNAQAGGTTITDTNAFLNGDTYTVDPSGLAFTGTFTPPVTTDTPPLTTEESPVSIEADPLTLDGATAGGTLFTDPDAFVDGESLRIATDGPTVTTLPHTAPDLVEGHQAFQPDLPGTTQWQDYEFQPGGPTLTPFDAGDLDSSALQLSDDIAGGNVTFGSQPLDVDLGGSSLGTSGLGSDLTFDSGSFDTGSFDTSTLDTGSLSTTSFGTSDLGVDLGGFDSGGFDGGSLGVTALNFDGGFGGGFG